METLKAIFQSVAYSIPNIGIMDIVDILVVAFVTYKVIGMLRSTTASRVAKGAMILIAVTFLTNIFQLNTLNFVFSKVLELGFVALIIVFQPELRRLLERVGSKKISELLKKEDRRSELETAIEATVNACEILSREHTGALIVFERNIPLEEYFKSGTVLDARISSQLLRSMFFPKSALHDGAVILQQGRLAAASCVLPLTQNTHLNSDLGTRHRAGIGLSEVSDAVVVIISEETGTVSVAVGGMLKRHLAPQMLQRLLTNELLGSEQEGGKGLLDKLRRVLDNGGTAHEEK